MSRRRLPEASFAAMIYLSGSRILRKMKLGLQKLRTRKSEAPETKRTRMHSTPSQHLAPVAPGRRAWEGPRGPDSTAAGKPLFCCTFSHSAGQRPRARAWPSSHAKVEITRTGSSPPPRRRNGRALHSVKCAFPESRVGTRPDFYGLPLVPSLVHFVATQMKQYHIDRKNSLSAKRARNGGRRPADRITLYGGISEYRTLPLRSIEAHTWRATREDRSAHTRRRQRQRHRTSVSRATRRCGARASGEARALGRAVARRLETRRAEAGRRRRLSQKGKTRNSKATSRHRLGIPKC